jgi:hypothetical protein
MEVIEVGVEIGDGTGDPLPVAFGKANVNFSDLYASEKLKPNGPLSSGDRHLVRYLGADGTSVQDSSIAVSDDGMFSGQAADVRVKTASYTLSRADAGAIIEFDSASPVTLTLPAGMQTGAVFYVAQRGAGFVSFVAGAGATLQSVHGFTRTRFPGSMMALYVSVTGAYQLNGEGTA